MVGHHFCIFWERDSSLVAPLEVSLIFSLLKSFSFPLLYIERLWTEDVVHCTDCKPTEALRFVILDYIYIKIDLKWSSLSCIVGSVGSAIFRSRQHIFSLFTSVLQDCWKNQIQHPAMNN